MNQTHYINKLRREREECLAAIEGEVAKESAHYRRYLNQLRAKYNLPEHGLTFEKGCEPRVERTLQEVVDKRQRDAAKGVIVSYGTTEFGGRTVPVWYEIRP